eukprot:CFRG7248T1
MQDKNEVSVSGESFVDHAVGYSKKNSSPSVTDESSVVTLTVEIKFKTLEQKETMLNEFAVLAKYVEDSEPNTLTYKLLQSDKDDLYVNIWERYVAMTDKEDIHDVSKPFLSFMSEFKPMIERGELDVTLSTLVNTGT